MTTLLDTPSSPAPSAPVTTESGYGPLLRQWRQTRRMSQLALAYEADVSPKHVSFLETGRAHPSRDMVLRLAGVLNVPIRHSNRLLAAAGYTAAYTETDLDAPELSEIKRSVELLIDRHNPYPAVVMDSCWNVHLQNDASLRLTAALLGPERGASMLNGEAPLNLVRLLFHPEGLRPTVVNWDEVASAVIQRLHREIAVRGVDPQARRLLEEILEGPDVPKTWREPDVQRDPPVIVPLHLRHQDLELKLFTAITTLGTALDVTLAELMIETFLPSDQASEEALRALCED